MALEELLIHFNNILLTDNLKMDYRMDILEGYINLVVVVNMN